jgi:hypothetical protein
VLKFNCQKTIKIVCWFKDEKWQFGSITIDPDIEAFFKRNGFVPVVDKYLPPHAYFSRILEFLGKNRLDGSLYEECSGEKHVAIITVEKRSLYSHSG